MDSLIDPAQAAYIQGRSILDNILYAHKALYHARHLDIKGILCKLDFSKVFDRLDLNYFISLLKHRDSPNRWLG